MENAPKPKCHQTENDKSKKTPSPMIKPFYLVTFGFVQLPTVRTILKFVSVLYILLVCFFVVVLLLTSDSSLLVQTGGIITIATNHLYVTWVTFIFEKKFTKILSEIASQKIWDEMFTARINTKITTEARIITYCEIGALISFLIFSVECWPVFNISGNVFVGISLLKTVFGPISNIVISTVYLTFPVVGYTGFVGGGLIIYMIFNIKFYVYCISHRLKKLSEKKLDDYNETAEFHLEVFSDLKTCIRCHQLVQIAVRKLNDVIEFPAVAIILLAMTVIVGALFNSFLYEIESATDYIFILHYMVITSTVPAGIIYAAQTFINEHDKVYRHLENCQWFEWNSTNKTMMLIFLQNSQKSIYIGHRNILRLEFSFLPKGLKFLWSATVFFIHIVKK